MSNIPTTTLALPKTGLLSGDAKQYTGEIYLIDLSVPDKIYNSLGIDTKNVFSKTNIIHL